MLGTGRPFSVLRANLAFIFVGVGRTRLPQRAVVNGFSSFTGIATGTKRLDVGNVIIPAFDNRHDMVSGQLFTLAATQAAIIILLADGLPFLPGMTTWGVSHTLFAFVGVLLITIGVFLVKIMPVIKNLFTMIWVIPVFIRLASAFTSLANRMVSISGRDGTMEFIYGKRFVAFGANFIRFINFGSFFVLFVIILFAGLAPTKLTVSVLGIFNKLSDGLLNPALTANLRFHNKKPLSGQIRLMSKQTAQRGAMNTYYTGYSFA